MEGNLIERQKDIQDIVGCISLRDGVKISDTLLSEKKNEMAERMLDAFGMEKINNMHSFWNCKCHWQLFYFKK